MKLKVRPLTWSAGRPVGVLHKDIAEHLNLHLNDRIIIKKGKRKLICILDLSETVVKKQEIFLSSEVLSNLNLKKGDFVEVEQTSKPRSLHYIRKKLAGEKLEEQEITTIILDIVNNALTQPEIAFFVSAVYNHGMTEEETFYLIKAIVKTGLNIKKYYN